MQSTRIDKWLWAARCFKTRSQASAACVAGHVTVNEEPAKASKTVSVGDRVVARTPGGQRILEVVAIAEKRGPASVAATLFVDHTPPEPPRPRYELAGEQRERGAGRPTKRERRRMDRLKEG
ncbi:MAG: RNA-binding S4 domain-containing protein [Alphaproteobacteria bacterium]|nr:RNA-binding S4 domain-containing protein [Alphaproteobacteria bacterium]MCB9796640.1 RNA-binding S4 domain-containing protein [Alphaproteobacteria bacterium]